MHVLVAVREQSVVSEIDQTVVTVKTEPMTFPKPLSKTQTPKQRVPSISQSSSAIKDKKRRFSKIEDTDTLSQTGSINDLTETQTMFQGDFSKTKVTNQVPLAQFYTYMDQFFRPFTQDDVNYLEAQVNFHKETSTLYNRPMKLRHL